jgi:hypothetical protein
MTTTDSYRTVAQAYADGVRVLFAPPRVPAGERGGHGPVSPEDLAEQAEKLSPQSRELAQVAATRLADPDPVVRMQASTSLLAKALTDLEISAHLFRAAEDEEHKIAWAEDKSRERSQAGPGTVEDYLKIILGEDAVYPKGIVRGMSIPGDIPKVRVALSNAIEDALALILERASKTGQETLNRLFGLGVTSVAQAVGAMGMDIAQALGQTEKVTHLYNLFRDFALKAYDSLIALIGQPLLQEAAQKVLDWLNEIRESDRFGRWLEKLYETEQTKQNLNPLVIGSQADLEKFVTAIQGVDGLNEGYRQQMDLAEKFLKRLKFWGGMLAAVLPHGMVLLAAVYVALGAYVVLIGADYVDARQLKLLNRVPGVRQIVETNLR